MRIKKKLNNNVVIAIDALNREKVLIGNGIAYGKNINDRINENEVEKVFTTSGKGVADKLSKIIEDTPLEYIKVCDEIINMAKKELGGRISERIYLTLIDHLCFAIERHKQGVDISSLLKWELKKIASEEYNVGLKAIDIIEKRLNIRLPDDEAVYIAFHLIDARSRNNEKVRQTIDFTSDVLEIINNHYDIAYYENSQPYDRFMIHLQYLSRRIFDKEENHTNNSSLYNDMKEKEMPCINCVEDITRMIADKYDYALNDNEKAYLLIHLNNLVH